MDQDDQFMRLALELGSRGGHKVLPNPRVGCILVRDGEVIAEDGMIILEVYMLSRWLLPMQNPEGCLPRALLHLSL